MRAHTVKNGDDDQATGQKPGNDGVWHVQAKLKKKIDAWLLILPQKKNIYNNFQ